MSHQNEPFDPVNGKIKAKLFQRNMTNKANWKIKFSPNLLPNFFIAIEKNFLKGIQNRFAVSIYFILRIFHFLCLMLWSLNYFTAKASPLLSCNMEFPWELTLLIPVSFQMTFNFQKSERGFYDNSEKICKIHKKSIKLKMKKI